MQLSRFAALFAFASFAVAIPAAKAPSELVARANVEARGVAVVPDVAVAKREPGHIAVESRQVLNVQAIINAVLALLPIYTTVFGTLANAAPAILAVILTLIGSPVSASDLINGVVTITQAVAGTAFTTAQLIQILLATIPGVVAGA